MGIKCGIVGLPNVGKSSLFNTLTHSMINAQNYPFCTIEPNLGTVTVPDQRIQQLTQIVSPQRTVPTTMEFVDIAGLVAGASKGEGLGNQFLAHIRETHALAQVVRLFDDDNVIHVLGKVDPLVDIEIINIELCLADQATLTQALQKMPKMLKDKATQQQLFTQAIDHLDQGKPIRTMHLDEVNHARLLPFHLLTQKPMLYIANIADTNMQNNTRLEKLAAFAASENTEIIPICVAAELELSELDAVSQKEFLNDLGFAETGLNRFIQASYSLLGMQTYFTAGEKEVRAWTLAKGANAKSAAGRIHKDFEKGFIRAEVIAYNDFIEFQGEQGAKDAGKWRLEGKEYIVQDGDIMHFRFNV